MKKTALVVAALLAALLVASGCGNQVPTGAIATVGENGVITKAQFDKIIDEAKAQAKQSQITFPKVGSYSYNQYAAQVVDSLVQQEVLNQAAAAWKITVTDAEVKDWVTQIEQYYGGAKKVDELLKQSGMTRADLNEVGKNNVLDQKVFEHVTKGVKITDAQAQAYYDKNKAQYVKPETRTMRHILVKTKAEAEKVRALLLADPSTANWKKVAKQHSTDPGSKGNGGDLGAVTPGEMFAAFEKVAFALKVNTISQPVHTAFGWHVIEVTKIGKGSTQTFAQAKASIKATLLQTAQNTAWTKWLNAQVKKAKVLYAAGYDPAKLKATKPESASPSASPTGSPSATASPQASPSPSATQ
jgi:parvulin-like peptidyl-prolyl isomerase